jgi:hypothetical protein
MSVPVHPVATGTRNPIGVLLLGSVVPSVAAVAVLAALSWLASADAAVSVLVGGGMAVLALAVAPVLHQLCRNLDPNILIGIVVLAYCVVVLLAGYGFSQVNDASWLIGGFAAGGVLAGAGAWVAGHIRSSLKLRQPMYGD